MTTINIVFIGHVDSGKSTLCGQILIKNNQVDPRILEKYEKLAKEYNRANWYISYLLDTDTDEREKGKTIDVGTSAFYTGKRNYTILDAPGHRNYIPNMISGVSQADIAVLNISAKTGEFESGFELDGQTKEHAIIAKTFGIDNMIVCINKMDTIKWDAARYDYIKNTISKYLKKIGYKNFYLLPISGFEGFNISERMSENFFPEYPERKCLFEILDEIELTKKVSQQLRITVTSTFEDSGNLFINGKVISGNLNLDEKLFVSPLNQPLSLLSLQVNDIESKNAKERDIVCVKAENSQIKTGDVIGTESDKPPYVIAVSAMVFIHYLLPNKPIFSSGYKCVLHIHNVQVECEIHSIKQSKFLRVETQGEIIITFTKPISCESFQNIPELARFLLRDEGKTVAIGKVIKTFSQKKK
jgi:peptide chain release factor subunit 3